jgi:hypothetical protein
MGSGAFLVAACRFLAEQYERALIREGTLSAGDIDDADRAGFRRTIAQRCLFGVDVNPMAVQLGRLSLWLATLAGDRPLTFLDHNLRPGNSLVGASLADILRQPSPGRPAVRAAALPLFAMDALHEAVGSAAGTRVAIATDPGETVEQVRRKERLLAQVSDRGAPLQRWKAAADLWCAAWFGQHGPPPSRGEFASLLDHVLGRPSRLPDHLARPLLEAARRTAEGARFFHWTFEFPEVFSGEDGAPLQDAGFDAMIGNPPWEMLRGTEGHGDAGGGSCQRRSLVTYARGSGQYRLQGGGHANLYQLFLERALSLLRPGGRLGLVLPSGFATDHGCTALRRHVLTRTTIDTFTMVENREGIFPIHRGIKFLLLTLTNSGETRTVPLRAGLRSADILDRVPDAGPDDNAIPVSRSLLERTSGPLLTVPELRTRLDLDILGRIAFSTPALGDAEGWNVHVGRELNATDDRRHFHDGPGGLPVVEGKHLQPFKVDLESVRLRIARRPAAQLLGPDGPHTRPRLGYREVAASTNRLTLIAAILPAGVVTTHTIFCMKESLDEEAQSFLCGMFNSYVANYLVRMRVGTHVTSAIIERLPVPSPPRDDPRFRDMARLARGMADRADPDTAARLQAAAARLYGLSDEAFQHVLATLNLVPAGDRARALEHFRYSEP